jgi:hypothetical protein
MSNTVVLGSTIVLRFTSDPGRSTSCISFRFHRGKAGSGRGGSGDYLIARDFVPQNQCNHCLERGASCPPADIFAHCKALKGIQVCLAQCGENDGTALCNQIPQFVPSILLVESKALKTVQKIRPLAILPGDRWQLRVSNRSDRSLEN